MLQLHAYSYMQIHVENNYITTRRSGTLFLVFLLIIACNRKYNKFSENIENKDYANSTFF